MKKMMIPLGLGFGVTLAFLVGQRMSADAMAVIVGVAVGVAASVPVSILLVTLLRRERRGWAPDVAPVGPPHSGYTPQLSQPNFIVLNPGDLWGGRQGAASYVPLPPETPEDMGIRRLRVIGEEDEWV